MCVCVKHNLRCLSIYISRSLSLSGNSNINNNNSLEMAAPAIVPANYKLLWVEAFAVNVGVGDSTILVLLGDPIVGPEENVVLRTVLIDGGYASHEDYGSVVKLSYLLSLTIPNIYRSPEPLKLDSIVITHWHSDHHAGVVGLLSADIQAQIIVEHFNLLLGEQATIAQVNKFIPTALEARDVRCAHLKYDTNGLPLTVLYVPYTVPGPTQDGPPYAFIFNHLDGTVDLNIWKKRDPRVVRGVCRFISNADMMLGANVFTHDPPPAPRYYASPMVLADAHGIGPCPGLFIVATDNKIIPAAAAPAGPPPFPAYVLY